MRGLTAEQVHARRDGIGASDAAKIVDGRWLELYLEKIGESEPEDLSWVLPVQIGIVTEHLNVEFFQHATGHQVFGQGERYRHPEHDFITATLDGLTLIDGKPAILECKHVNPFAKIEEIEQRYYPQCAHSMLVTGALTAYLSVFLGTQKHEIVEIHRDRDYTSKLLDLEIEFWRHVTNREQPPDHEGLAAPVKVDALAVYDMLGNNEFASHADAWLSTHKHARSFEIASKALKKIVPDDAKKCFGYGISIERNRAGALSIRAEK